MLEALPNSIRAFLNEDIQAMRKNQELTLAYYKADASQYDSDHSLKIRRICDSMTSAPCQSLSIPRVLAVFRRAIFRTAERRFCESRSLLVSGPSSLHFK